MATHREDRPLKRCLDSIASQLEPGDEVIVVLDVHSSTLPGVETLVTAYGSQFRTLSLDAGHHCWGHCVLPDTVLESADVELGYRRVYDGPAIELSCGTRRLTITPNHPILTKRGWVAAGEIHQGDYLISAPFGQRAKVSEPDIQRQPAAASQIFDTLWYFGLRQRMPGLSMQFHGDRCDSQIDVVRADRLLRNNAQAPRLKPAAHLPFANPQLLRADSLLSNGLTCEMDGRVSVSTASSNARGSHGSLLLSSHNAHPDQLRLAVRAQRDAAESQPVANGLAANANLSSDSVECAAPAVALDQVTHVRRFAYNGHVYNLQTRCNWYLANGFIVHNCQHNYAITQARGDYIHLNDDDDVWAPDAAKNMRTMAKAYPGRVLLFRFVSYIGRVTYWVKVGQMERNWIGGHCLVTPNVPEKIGKFTCEYSGDYDWIEQTVNNFGGPQEAIWVADVVAFARP